ncbi:uncharacterized protein LOC113508824 [Trichoplusia ni]|uniref:Uncharacterized protein LOC113508824 n=1 Tax=Trichoplusia ni TaxID=7111 RepID=A0A7E5X3F7_TRINI|nr:uncharacterized protein LOC113508824 [Trichoplusia ni]
MMQAVSAFIILCHLHVCYSAFKPHLDLAWPGPPISWSDDEDLYFDRIVPLSITIANYTGSDRHLTNIGISCLIDENRVITAYNPFRTILFNEKMIEHTVASVLQSRKRIPNQHSEFTYNIHNITCGRRVVFINENYLTHKQWHGRDRKQSPVHDLLVLRIFPQINKFKDWSPETHTMSKHYSPDSKVIEQHDLVFKTELALPTERFTYPFKVGTLEPSFDPLLGQQGLTLTFEKVSAAILDCSEWLPKYWGHFICIANDFKLKTLAAGSMLVSKNKLFGVGSFIYFRGGNGVLVFTDVRRYYDHIMFACTDEDWMFMNDEL